MINNLNELVNVVISPLTKEDEAVAGFRLLHQNATRHGGLGNMLGRSHDLLSALVERDQQIEKLKAQVEAARLSMVRAERSRKALAAEQESNKREVEARISEVVKALVHGAPLSLGSSADSMSGSRSQRVTARSKASAMGSSRARPRVVKKPRGADTDQIVFNLLTNEWKCISTLLREAQHSGFTGSEGAIRFAAERVERAGNAQEGQDRLGRKAYRRAV